MKKNNASTRTSENINCPHCKKDIKTRTNFVNFIDFLPKLNYFKIINI